MVEYSYDVFDQRVGKDVDDDGDQDVDRGERYVYDGGFGLPSPFGRGAGGEGIALQFDGSSNLTHRYLFGPAVDQILADEDASGDVLWSLADHEGTVRDLAAYDSGQDVTTVVNHVKYDAFGNITGQSNSSLTPHFAYTGREWDGDAGLYYYRARWYDPKTGRFLSEDPVGFAGGDANLHRYVFNNPLNFIDPSGMSGGGSGSGGDYCSGGGDSGGTDPVVNDPTPDDPIPGDPGDDMPDWNPGEPTGIDPPYFGPQFPAPGEWPDLLPGEIMPGLPSIVPPYWGEWGPPPPGAIVIPPGISDWPGYWSGEHWRPPPFMFRPEPSFRVPGIIRPFFPGAKPIYIHGKIKIDPVTGKPSWQLEVTIEKPF